MEANGGTDDPGADAPITIGAAGGVTPGTHHPFVTVYVGDQIATLGLAHALEMGSSIFQAAAMALQDAMLVDYFFLVMGMDKVQAIQQLTNFQTFRDNRINAHNRAVQRQQQPPEEGKP